MIALSACTCWVRPPTRCCRASPWPSAWARPSEISTTPWPSIRPRRKRSCCLPESGSLHSILEAVSEDVDGYDVGAFDRASRAAGVAIAVVVQRARGADLVGGRAQRPVDIGFAAGTAIDERAGR